MTTAVKIPVVFVVAALIVYVSASPDDEIILGRLIPPPLGILSSLPGGRKDIVPPVIRRHLCER